MSILLDTCLVVASFDLATFLNSGDLKKIRATEILMVERIEKYFFPGSRVTLSPLRVVLIVSELFIVEDRIK